MLVGDLPPSGPHVVIVEPAQTQTKSAFSDSGRIRRPPSGGAIATGMLDGEPEKPEQPELFVTRIVESGRSSAARAWIEEPVSTEGKFRNAAAALAQIEAAQELLKGATETDVRLSLARVLDSAYAEYFKLVENERQGLTTAA